MKKSRMNILILAVSIFAIISVFLMTGCGNGCGQVLEADSVSEDGVSMSYISVPLCGGCTTSGWGCMSCLWGEKCVLSTMNVDISEENEFTWINCSELYYGNSCLGCGYQPTYIYDGLIGGTINGKDIAGCISADTNSDDVYICGYYDGCACSTKMSNEEFAYFVYYLADDISQNEDITE